MNYNFKVKLDGKLIRPSKYMKYLEVFIDPNLKWNYNTKVLASKFSRSIGMLSRIRHYVNVDTLRTIYFAIFSSHLSYGSIIWAQNSSNQNVKRILRLQNKALRVISFANYRDHADPLYNNLNILKLNDSVKLNNLLLVYDSLNNRLPSVLNNVYTHVKSIHNYNTRSSSKLKLLIPKVDTTTHGLNSVEYKSIKDWNRFIDDYPNLKVQELKRSNFNRSLLHYFSGAYS